MKAILNDVDYSFEGKLEVIDVKASKKEFCKQLKCNYCLKSSISIKGSKFGVVYPKDMSGCEWPNVSMINSSGDPDFTGSYLLFGITKEGELIGLKSDEIKFLLEHFQFDNREDGRGKYVLYAVDVE